MPQENIRYVPVWSGWVRLTHWLIAAGVLFQFASAWAIGLGAADYAFWRDWHLICGQLLVVAVAARVILLFMLPGSAHWRALSPDRAQWAGAKQMLLFYLSFARWPLPNWFAHNPFWRQLYPLLWLVLLACAFSGLYYNSASAFLGMSMFNWHRVLADFILIFTVAHLLAVFLHDLKGKGATVSGMISGYRYFHIEGQAGGKDALPAGNQSAVVHVSIDRIGKPPKR
ncbi:cytochrome b/b6 domain-containing protein [Candidatus Thiothrix sp. Deng01]|uniref:Cytochrome b/b6 domain-containing protein n=1 Tax=Candidatus Thiothrix phosphatis TaxID=3112415 RepID=A0ABU6CV29_9GAMM|nr:cytochrome b/b6 domain-containing protein [Candidatus Thiothrix sp. Deng01]MEB4590243.1 cytochrome b/b6 domain-containing protein [Candidatus Thiothrix sp. Deng01]